MGVVISLIRNALGGILVCLDIITRGTKLKREPLHQQQLNSELESLTLYQFFACPFCIKTRRKMYQLNLPINKLSVTKGSPHREELHNGGGKIQTPCLRIEERGEVQWLYDSNAIINYLEKRFS